jgi:aspartate/methionine/tyrosine aminotransferase
VVSLCVLEEGERLSVSKRVQSIEPSPIRKIIDLAETRPDIIGLHAGEPDFPTPKHIVEAGSRALDDGYTHYTHGAGILQLREAISRKVLQENGIEANPKTEITVTAGGFAAIFATIQATINPGDEVIVLQPSWPSYAGFVRLADGVPVPVSLRGPDFEPSRADLKEHITERTKMILVNSPNNPTGAVYSQSCLFELAKLAKEHGLLVLTDEVYEKIVFDGNKHFSIASRPEFKDFTITVNSFSKTYAMTGWRIGYVVASESITNGIRKIHGYMASCAPSSAQKAALEALSGSQDCISEMIDEYRRRRNLIVRGLNEIDGFQCMPPKGTFYAFPSVSRIGMPSAKIAEELLEQARLAGIPGSAFGEAGEGYLRLSFATSQRNIQEALARIKTWRAQHR